MHIKNMAEATGTNSQLKTILNKHSGLINQEQIFT